jgi:glycosyltransferase involved in cell wall biosynthesis
MPKKRLLIFVVAYHAESTLEQVLDRIPRSLFSTYDCEVLVIDDASTDGTLQIGRRYRSQNADIPLRVLQNRYNQGYGGNQQVGYTYAIKEGFDLVALLHGDAQYAPEELPRLAQPVADGEADAVFGSRMMVPGAARKGGMPFYKLVGNKILTAFQNAVLRTKLSEFHSGYRVYSVAALRRIPFRLNSTDFHFDTEIIIQLLNLGARIVELPIPTYYGDEICRVNGMRYAKDVALATLRNAAHRAGIYYQRRFDVETGNAHYGPKLGYASSHSFAIDAVPPGSRVIDVGGGSGFIAAELAGKDCDVHIVDQFPATVRHQRVTFEVRDLDGGAAVATKGYDHLLLLDIIEHLANPEAFLEAMRAGFDHDRKVLVLTTPNIAFIVQRLQLLLGQFNYGKAGILDITHRRLFTFRGIRRLLDDAGFRDLEIRGVPAPFPKVLGDGALGRLAVSANLMLIKVSKTLFSYQIFVVAKGTPSVDFLLEDTKSQEAAAEASVGKRLTGEPS